MLNIGVWANFLSVLTERPMMYGIMPILLILCMVLLIKPQLITGRTNLTVSTVRSIAAILAFLCFLYFVFIAWLAIGFGQGPVQRGC